MLNGPLMLLYAVSMHCWFHATCQRPESKVNAFQRAHSEPPKEAAWSPYGQPGIILGFSKN